MFRRLKKQETFLYFLYQIIHEGEEIMERNPTNIFELLEKINKLIDEETREMRKEIFELQRELYKETRMHFINPKEFEAMPFIYGFRITIGDDGVPKIEKYGNIRINERPHISEEIEPLVDVIEKGDEIRIVAEVPGANKEQIKVKLIGNKIVIQAQGEDRKYYKEIELPADVDDKNIKAVFNNGILQITLKRKPKQETEVKID